MKKYEYRKIRFKGGFGIGSEETICGLNIVGDDGWLLIQPLPLTKPAGANWWEGIFVREVDDAA